MNTQLEKLFEKYNISPNSRHEINQIFPLLPIDKQQNLINNFDVLSIKLEKIEKDLEIEREILIPEAIEDIKGVIEKVKKERISRESKIEINLLKQNV